MITVVPPCVMVRLHGAYPAASFTYCIWLVRVEPLRLYGIAKPFSVNANGTSGVVCIWLAISNWTVDPLARPLIFAVKDCPGLIVAGVIDTVTAPAAEVVSARRLQIRTILNSRIFPLEDGILIV